MTRALLPAATPMAAAIAALLSTTALAQTSPIPSTLDPLHGCQGSATATTLSCSENSSMTNTPTTSADLNFTFTVSPGPASGDLVLDILVPDTEDTTPSVESFTINQGTTALGSTAYEGNFIGSTSDMNPTIQSVNGAIPTPASPDNKLGAYLPATQALTPALLTDQGFQVYQINLGTESLQGAGDTATGPIFNVNGLLDGGYIIGFLLEPNSTSWIATANSGAIFETAGPTLFMVPPVDEPPAGVILIGGLIALAALGLRNSTTLNRWGRLHHPMSSLGPST